MSTDSLSVCCPILMVFIAMLYIFVTMGTD